MKTNVKEQGTIERSLCMSCKHYPMCKLQRQGDVQVFFCEEIDLGALPDQGGEEPRRTAAPSKVVPITLRKPEAARSRYVGLCRKCKKLPTCTFTKPGGGTWVCEAYEA
ncbi:MAG: hypothetical protein JW821_10255 [Deltaproteobacteria bacterium]|nr:hypothetical protein [Deltaproteobacteria bacterium]